MLSVRELRKAYGSIVALAGVDLDVPAGEVVCLLGPNGAGKTTLVSIVAGLRRPDAGTVVVDGIDVLHHPVETRRRLGLAPQELGVYPTLTVAQNLRFYGELVNLRGANLSREMAEVAEAFDLTGLMARPTRMLSGGERRRLHTALAILGHPRLLLLDEPTSGVDVASRAHILEVIRRLADDGTAICYSTHYLGEVEVLKASVSIVDRGKVIARGSMADLVRRHGSPAIELTFDCAENLPHLNGYRVDSEGAVLRVYADRPAEEAPAILSALGREANRLRSFEIVAPSLDAVFLALTGRRYEPGGSEEASGVIVP